MLLREVKKKPRQFATKKPARNEKVLRYYLKIIKEEGARALVVSKTSIYEMVGDVFDITGCHAGRIIRGMITDNNYRNYLSEKECMEYVDILVKMNPRIIPQ